MVCFIFLTFNHKSYQGLWADTRIYWFQTLVKPAKPFIEVSICFICLFLSYFFLFLLCFSSNQPIPWPFFVTSRVAIIYDWLTQNYFEKYLLGWCLICCCFVFSNESNRPDFLNVLKKHDNCSTSFVALLSKSNSGFQSLFKVNTHNLFQFLLKVRGNPL